MALHRCGCLIFAAVLAWGGHALGAEDPLAKLKSPEARKALAWYEGVVSEASQEFHKKLAPAQKTLLAALEVAQAKAVQANELDDAVLIREIRKQFEVDQEVIEPASGSQIIAAFYGQNVSWIDVTDKVRKAVKGKRKWSAIVTTKDLGDPAPGWAGTRTLLVRYLSGGRVMHKAAYEGKEISLP